MKIIYKQKPIKFSLNKAVNCEIKINLGEGLRRNMIAINTIKLVSELTRKEERKFIFFQL